MSTKRCWAFCQLVLMSRTICVGEVFLWDTVSVVLEDCDSSVFWCVNVYSICVIGIFVVFCKMGSSGSIH